MKKFIAYALIGLVLAAATTAVVTSTRPAVAAGCNGTAINC
jgi:hypothetical protein